MEHTKTINIVYVGKIEKTFFLKNYSPLLNFFYKLFTVPKSKTQTYTHKWKMKIANQNKNKRNSTHFVLQEIFFEERSIKESFSATSKSNKEEKISLFIFIFIYF